MEQPSSAPPARPPDAASARPSGPRRVPWLKILVAVTLLALLLFAGRKLGVLLGQAAGKLDQLGPWATVAFVAAYAMATVLLLPGSILTLVGGALFGLVRGTLLVLLGATLGASAAFLVARHLARRLVERRLASNPTFAAVDAATAREGLKIVFLLRLSPIFPFNLLNYALGLTRVRWRDFLLASIGMLPGTLLYTYYGKVIGDVAMAASGARVPHDVAYWSVLALGLFATAIAAAVVTRAAKRALAESLDD